MTGKQFITKSNKTDLTQFPVILGTILLPKNKNDAEGTPRRFTQLSQGGFMQDDCIVHAASPACKSPSGRQAAHTFARPQQSRSSFVPRLFPLPALSGRAAAPGGLGGGV